jgi:hypothetical protein
MTDYQQSQFKMILETLDFLKTSFDFKEAAENATQGIMEKHYEEGVVIKKEIFLNIEIQEADTSGYSRKKKEKKKNIAILDYELSSGLRSYAQDTDNAPVFDEFDLSQSKINKLPNIDFLAYTNNLIKSLNKYSKEIEPYGISADDIVNLSANLQEYNDILLEPAKHKDNKKVASNNIKTLISDELNLFKTSIDNDMQQYRTTKPELFKKYWEARQIDDMRGRAMSIRGKITGGEAEVEILQYVKITAQPETGQAKKATSTLKGNYQFKGLPEGKCKLTFTLEYYDNVVVDSIVRHGKATIVNVVMRKTV